MTRLAFHCMLTAGRFTVSTTLPRSTTIGPTIAILIALQGLLVHAGLNSTGLAVAKLWVTTALRPSTSAPRPESTTLARQIRLITPCERCIL